MKILGIETSCDETGVAVYAENQGIVADQVYTQQLHQDYGGVVPELASRDHIRKLLPMVESVLQQARLKRTDLDGIAYTAGPGLVGALFVGAVFARTLGWALGVPTVGVHHMEGHLLAPLLEANKPSYPFLALLVSGGHTLLVQVESLGAYTVLGESIDDAVGEAFDKTAKLLGLGYPGGAKLAALAEQGSAGLFEFPRPMLDRPGLNFSFSGLKTAVNTAWQACKQDDAAKRDIAYAFQEAVVETLVKKCERAIMQTGMKYLVVAGGVSANLHLRQQLTHLLQSHQGEVYFPQPRYCTDNGAMIAYAGFCRLKQGQQDDLSLNVRPRWPLTDLQTLQNLRTA